MKLLIVGDSFCADGANDQSWVKQLSLAHGHDVISKSFPGQSWWHQRRWLINNIDVIKADVLIILHPNKSRLHSIEDDVLNQGTMFALDESELSSIQKLAKKVYASDLFDPEYQTWAIKKWVNEISFIHTEKFKKVIQCLGSEDDETIFIDKISKNNIIVTTPLVNVSLGETGFKGFYKDQRSNHLNTENNLFLADFFHSLIHGDQMSGKVAWQTHE